MATHPITLPVHTWRHVYMAPTVDYIIAPGLREGAMYDPPAEPQWNKNKLFWHAFSKPALYDTQRASNLRSCMGKLVRVWLWHDDSALCCDILDRLKPHVGVHAQQCVHCSEWKRAAGSSVGELQVSGQVPMCLPCCLGNHVWNTWRDYDSTHLYVHMNAHAHALMCTHKCTYVRTHLCVCTYMCTHSEYQDMQTASTWTLQPSTHSSLFCTYFVSILYARVYLPSTYIHISRTYYMDTFTQVYLGGLIEACHSCTWKRGPCPLPVGSFETSRSLRIKMLTLTLGHIHAHMCAGNLRLCFYFKYTCMHTLTPVHVNVSKHVNACRHAEGKHKNHTSKAQIMQSTHAQDRSRHCGSIHFHHARSTCAYLHKCVHTPTQTYISWVH